MKTFAALCLTALFLRNAGADETQTLEQIDKQFRADLTEKIMSPWQDSLTKLKVQYINALENEKRAAAAASDLDSALKYDLVIKHMQSHRSSAHEVDTSSIPRLKQLHEVYQSSAVNLKKDRDSRALKLFNEIEQKLNRHTETSGDAKTLAGLRERYRLILTRLDNPQPLAADTVSGKLLLQGTINGKPVEVPPELRDLSFSWLDAYTDHIVAGSPESGVYKYNGKEVKHLYTEPVRYYASSDRWEFIYLTFDDVLRWKDRIGNEGEISEVKKFDWGEQKGDGGCHSLIALTKAGDIKLIGKGIEPGWNFNEWKQGKKFRDIAMSRDRGLKNAVLTICDSGDVVAFNADGMIDLPDSVKRNAASVSSANYSLKFAVISQNGTIHETSAPGDKFDGKFLLWAESPNRITIRKPVLYEQGAWGKALKFADNTWQAFDNRLRFANPVYRDITERRHLISLKVINTNSAKFAAAIVKE